MSIDIGMDKDFVHMYHEILGFLRGSVGKESDCNAGDLGLIPGLEDPLEEGMATQASIPPWRTPMDRGAWQATVHRNTKSRTELSN